MRDEEYRSVLNRYVDASALVKLTVPEAESAGMHSWYVEADRIVTSRVGDESRPVGWLPAIPPGRSRSGRSCARSRVFSSTGKIAELASALGPSLLRTNDATHLATALTFGTEIDAFVTYDDRLAAAAREVGLPVVRPA